MSFRRIVRWLRRSFLPTSVSDGKLRLHLGCGADYWPGYVNVDASPTAECDLQLDFSRIGEVYSEKTVTEVAMIHSLSYLRLWQARELLADLYIMLEPGGRLIIESPDLSKCALRALDNEGDLETYLEAVRGLYAFGMDQIERRELFTPYSFGWSSWHLTQELEQVGFRKVVLCKPQTHERRLWRDIRVEATK